MWNKKRTLVHKSTTLLDRSGQPTVMGAAAAPCNVVDQAGRDGSTGPVSSCVSIVRSTPARSAWRADRIEARSSSQRQSPSAADRWLGIKATCWLASQSVSRSMELRDNVGRLKFATCAASIGPTRFRSSGASHGDPCEARTTSVDKPTLVLISGKLVSDWCETRTGSKDHSSDCLI